MRQTSGTGQGAAAYGRGVAYVAENPKVSGPGESEYMKEFSRHSAVRNKQKLGTEPLDHVRKYAMGWIGSNEEIEKLLKNSGLASLSSRAFEYLMDRVVNYRVHEYANAPNEDFKTYVKRMNAEVRSLYPEMTSITNEVHEFLDKYFSWSPGTGGPFSYKVHVYLSPETTLDWNEEIRNHHPGAQEKILRAMDKSGLIVPGSHDISSIHGLSGQTIYSQLADKHGSNFDASEILFNHGIHGIRYLDQGSRGHIYPDIFIDGRKVFDGGKQEIEADFSEDYSKGKVDPEVFWVIGDIVTLYKNHGNNIVNSVRRFYRGVINNYKDKKSVDMASRALEWLNKNGHRLQFVPRKPTYNYVVFHPDFIKAVEQYNIKGEKIRDIPGVYLKEIDHDPFKDEGR
jgi:hypothetical protein